ncbi:MAG TPA: DUF934 domain-containing protein [Rhodocyclaceae bacterium]|nr:DUF934 domain-containing protein [Rhodocyclaceae bacterium]
MPKLIKNNAIVDDSWQVVRLAEGETPESVALPDGDLIVPFKVWKARRADLLARPQIGVWLAPDETANDIATDLKHLKVVAIDFPQFVDGRGYSTAALLRTRYGWSGELRAIGDVLRDQLFYMHRVGFDAYAIRADKDIANALEALNDFSESYQSDVNEPLPLFRRRHA